MSAEVTPALASYFKAGKGRTVALIVAGVIAIGALGAIVSLASGGEDEKLSPTGPGETSDFDPTPVKLPEVTDEGPSANPSQVDPTITEDTVTFGDKVQIPVPSPWKVLVKHKWVVVLNDDRGSFVKANTGSTNTSDALALVPNAEEFVRPTTATSFESVLPTKISPEGTIVSGAGFDYGYTLTDPQGAVTLIGRATILIRQDRTVLILGSEHFPGSDWDKTRKLRLPVTNGAINLFAGLSLPVS
jgi:hypothetical protein